MTFKGLTPWQQRGMKNWEKSDPFGLMQQEMNGLMDTFFNRPFNTAPSRAFNAAWHAAVPSMDVTETDKEMAITAELPGMEEKDIDLTIKDGMLTLSGEKKAETEHKDKNFHMAERSYGSFSRSIPLPDTVDTAKADATFKQGVLKISLPKNATAAEKIRKIAIKGA